MCWPLELFLLYSIDHRKEDIFCRSLHLQRFISSSDLSFLSWEGLAFVSIEFVALSESTTLDAEKADGLPGQVVLPSTTTLLCWLTGFADVLESTSCPSSLGPLSP